MASQHFLSKKIPVPIWLLIALPLAAYAAWEVYWYTQVGLNFIKWHTRYAVYAYLLFGGAMLFSFLKNKERQQKLSLGFSAVVLMLALSEFLLSTWGVNKTYVEQRSGFYQSVFNYWSKDSLHINYTPNGTHYLKSPEFNFERKANSHRFSDTEFVEKGASILLQTYGDSFTEGDGAPADSSYPAILRNLLGEGYVVQNYGISGNDPGFYVTQFGKVGSKFKPDIILLCYCTLDFQSDVLSRGGLERFTASGWQSRKGPWWEVIYGMSYVSRLFFSAAGIHYNNFFFTKAEKARQLKLLEPKWNEIFAEIARLAKEHNTKVLLFKKPERSEIELNTYQYDMAFFDEYVKNENAFVHVDLLPIYRQLMKMDEGGSTAPYYWPLDGHHNPAGYAVMARAVHEALKLSFLLDKTTP